MQSIDWDEIGVGKGEDLNNEVEMHYNGTVREILMVGEQYIPKSRIRSNRKDPKWMTNSIMRETGIKKGLYRSIKRGEA